MKLLYREMATRRATQRLLQKKNSPDLKQLRTLTGEIFELQRSILTKYQIQGVLATI